MAATEQPVPGTVSTFAGQDVLELTRALVAINSENPGGDERAIAAYVGDLARQEGFEVQEVAITPERPNLIIDIDAGGEAGVLALSGHLDTKPIGAAAPEWRTPPLELTIVDGLAYGLGTSDMKGALAAMLVAAKDWSAAAQRGRLRLVFTADEEAGSVHGAEALTKAGAVSADAMVVGEPSGVTGSWESIFTVSRGICCFTVEVETKQGHSGLSTRLPQSATLAAAQVALAIHQLRPSFDAELAFGSAPTVNSGVMIGGGVFYGVHPGHAFVSSDIRLVPGMTRELLDQELRAAIGAAVGDDVTWTLTYQDGPLGWMEPASVGGDHRVVAAAQSAARSVLGAELPLAAYPGGTDATAFILRGGIPTIASFGPGLLSVAHGPNEYVPVADLGTAAQLYVRLAEAYFA